MAACAANGSHYCDLTSAVHWMQRMIEAHQHAAAASGARIVFTCRFDCISSDLGAFFLQREMHARHGVSGSRSQRRVGGFAGGTSRGTVSSMLLMLEEPERDPAVMRAIGDPYALNPEGERAGLDAPEGTTPAEDDDFRQSTAPFVMAGINTKVVRREAGYCDLQLRGEHPTDPGKSQRGRVCGDRDQGYDSTSKMLGESAVCLVQDAISVGGGCWTLPLARHDQAGAHHPVRAAVVPF